MAIVIEEDVVRIEFKDKQGNPSGAYFTIHKELPYDGYLEYMDQAVDVAVDPNTGKVDASQAKVKIGKIADVLIKYGLISLEGVTDKQGHGVNAADYKRLPRYMIEQLSKAVQERNTGDLQDPNAVAPLET